jgi:hypothetical protein
MIPQNIMRLNQQKFTNMGFRRPTVGSWTYNAKRFDPEEETTSDQLTSMSLDELDAAIASTTAQKAMLTTLLNKLELLKSLAIALPVGNGN